MYVLLACFKFFLLLRRLHQACFAQWCCPVFHGACWDFVSLSKSQGVTVTVRVVLARGNLLLLLLGQGFFDLSDFFYLLLECNGNVLITSTLCGLDLLLDVGVEAAPLGSCQEVKRNDTLKAVFTLRAASRAAVWAS